MTEAERLWSAYIDAWNRHDIDGIVAAVAEQFIYDERPMTMTTAIRRRQAFREYLKIVFKMFPDLRIQTTLCDTGRPLTSRNR
jgi:predicted ester cyclase